MEFTARGTKRFLTDGGVPHWLSSVDFPQSNCRAEVGVNTASITDHHGNSDVDSLQGGGNLLLSEYTSPETLKL